MYTIKSLTEINVRYCNSSSNPYLNITDHEVTKANNYVNLIETTRSETEPKAGDILIYTDKFGGYYPYAHIEKVKDGEVEICEKSYVPFIRENNDKDGIYCSTSGGCWHNVPLKKLKYVGKKEKRFCDWGRFGACADGAIEFFANVSVWEYKEKSIFIDKNGVEYTEKDYDYAIISYDNGLRDSRYRYYATLHGYSHAAWTNEKDLQAWLRTHRATVFNHHNNSLWVWIWKEKTHNPSPDEFEKINGIEDTEMVNGSIMRCKRVYDEKNHILHTYYVWYWDFNINVDMETFANNAMEQNRIREERYVLDWRCHIPNEYAHKEIKSGQFKPYNLNFSNE